MSETRSRHLFKQLEHPLLASGNGPVEQFLSFLLQRLKRLFRCDLV